MTKLKLMTRNSMNLVSLAATALVMTACSSLDTPGSKTATAANSVPAKQFDLSHWKITLPTDEDGNGKVDNISAKDIQTFSHPEYFYLNRDGEMVFTAPNRGALTENTSNTRSELRYMLRGENKKLGSHDNGNNFSLRDHKNASEFGAIGGRMDATLKIDHVALNTDNPQKRGAHSAVIGQIHAVKFKDPAKGLPHGNEPLKIFYKKWPDHDTGSVFWTYERNLAKKDPNRRDIVYPVWGNTWENFDAPGASGVALGEEISYTVNVHENTMYLTFESPTKPTVKYALNLANNIDAYGKLDTLDNPKSYAADSLYFKAGVYNQCSSKTKSKPLGCHGTGNWDIDKANGDYAQVTFKKLIVGSSTPPK